MRKAIARVCLACATCLLLCGCPEEKDESAPAVQQQVVGSGGGAVTAVGSGPSPAVRINGCAGKVVVIKIYDANGKLLAAKKHTVPAPSWMFQPKLLPGQYIVDVFLGDLHYGRCKLIVTR